MMLKVLISVLIIYSVLKVNYISATLSKKSPRPNKEKEVKSKPADTIPSKIGPQNYTVFDKNLVSETVTAKDIIANHQAFFWETDEYKFDGLVLGYITPWNNHGYDIAKIFGNKFTHISPVWLQIKRKGTDKYEVTGTHDVDKKWMATVRNAGRERKLKIVPRILFDGWTGDDYTKLFASKAELEALTSTLVNECKKWKFDGYVIEVWSQIAESVPFERITQFIKLMAKALTLENLDTILAVPPKRGKDYIFTNKHFDELYDHVTAFSLMTYDFANQLRPGPNAPLPWMVDCITSLTPHKNKRKKILTGLNFYGNDYTSNGGGPIVAHEYLNTLQKLKGKMQFDSEMGEHYFDYKEGNQKHLVFYPTLQSINKRIELATALATGLSIWECGQGLDYFYDLL